MICFFTSKKVDRGTMKETPRVYDLELTKGGQASQVMRASVVEDLRFMIADIRCKPVIKVLRNQIQSNKRI